jgi:hypothetical protein
MGSRSFSHRRSSSPKGNGDYSTKVVNMEETLMASDPYNEKLPYGEKKFPMCKGSREQGQH